MKIPIKIIQVDTKGEKKNVVILNSSDYFELKSDSTEKIKRFEKVYSEIIKKAEKLFFGKDTKKEKKRREVLSTTYWELGNIFRKFNEKTENQFVITNYAQALERDFGLSYRYVQELIIFSKLFKKSEIFDSIPISIYRALVWKKLQLEALGLLEQELKKLINRGISGEKISRENYKKELSQLVKLKIKGGKK